MNLRPTLSPWTHSLVTAVLLMSIPACTLTGHPANGNAALARPRDAAAPASGSPVAATASPTPASASAKPAQARVAPNWQDKMMSELASGAWSEAWGLFSEGGWVDAGQVIVLSKPPKARLIVIEPGKKDYTTDRSLSEAELQSLTAVLGKVSSLTDIEEKVFDAVVFEFVRVKDARVVDSLYIRASGVTPYPEHDAIINAFQALRPKAP